MLSVVKTTYSVAKLFKILLPLLLAGVILWWMYRGFDWAAVRSAVDGGMDWTWMWLSMPFGITAQWFRALRWRQALRPLGERPRHTTALWAVFLSYAASLVVPRVGELLRCGVLKRYDGVDFAHGVGTVVTERVVDMLIVVVLTVFTVLLQIPVFTHFMASTGVTVEGLLRGFSIEGYAVTAACGLVAVGMALYMARRLGLWGRTRAVMSGLAEGLMSVRRVESKTLFLAYSLGIWVSYYLHFYLTFLCFKETLALGPTCALVAFVVGCFAVLVPTPNGAGPWHFAVKTVLMLYGVSATTGALFALIVHTLQTLLVVVLGLVAAVGLGMTRVRGKH